MKEKEFTEEIQQKLQVKLVDYEVLMGENLVYRVIIDDKIEYKPKNPKKPIRGNLSFQTDLMIKQNSVPLVIIEIKYGKFTTHDVLVYSIKAQKHKEIYPYIRYGLLIGDYKIIYNRFFTHNFGFDFALAIADTEIGSINKLTRVINAQIENAEKLLNILKKGNNVILFNTVIETEYV